MDFADAAGTRIFIGVWLRAPPFALGIELSSSRDRFRGFLKSGGNLLVPASTPGLRSLTGAFELEIYGGEYGHSAVLAARSLHSSLDPELAAL